MKLKPVVGIALLLGIAVGPIGCGSSTNSDPKVKSGSVDQNAKPVGRSSPGGAAPGGGAPAGGGGAAAGAAAKQ